MNTYHLRYKINDHEKVFDVTSKYFRRGENNCIYNEMSHYNNDEFVDSGFIIRSLPVGWFTKINNAITNYVSVLLEKQDIDTSGFTLEKYHKYVNTLQHKNVVDSFRGGMLGVGGIHLDYLGIPYKELDSFITENIEGNYNFSCHYRRYGLSLKHFWIRIIRPNSNDNNPPHKDSHIKRNRNMVISFLPLAGSNKKSSLPVIPGSHLEMESEYIISASPSYVDGKRFNVPSIVHRNKGLNLTTPNPSPNEIMIFNPYLIHGGGINRNTDTTRVSLETRFFK